MDGSADAIIAHRYAVIDLVGEGGMGQVFRARDRLTGQIIAVKRVRWSSVPRELHLPSDALTRQLQNPGPLFEAVSEDQPTRAIDAWIPAAIDLGPHQPMEPHTEHHESVMRLALAQEFRTLAGLRHPNIISVLDYGFEDDKRPFFTMEFLEGARDLSAAAAGKSPREKMQLLCQVLDALHYLHRHGILHRDLKPRNVLVLGDDEPQAKVLDFGLAAAREELHRRDCELAGTLLFMAPELLREESASPASDLYAVGLMAYELLTGRHPFSGLSGSEALILAILDQPPDLSPLQQLPQLSALIARLLSKDPQQRLGSADAVARALAAAALLPRPAEPAGVRNSFLAAARFVGRDAELATLGAALAAARAGEGSGWLLGGESGVGKSRLLDELRTQALVQGVRVLRGQATQHSAGGLELFREVLRGLCLKVPLSPLEASVLKALAPDLASLLDRPVEDAPPIEAKAAQRRLFETLEAVILRAGEPLLILLEDLHWASADALEVLRHVLPRLADQPVLVVGSYRHDERQGLPGELPSAHTLTLPRLDLKDITHLSVSMLGEAGERPDLLELLQRETEGNTFFVVEVVRALAEEAGSLSAVAERTLPRRVAAGGIQSVVERRLERVPQAAQALLRLAAVAGRQLDLRLLAELEPQLESCLHACAQASVLEVDAAQWRFAHDKLRQGVLSTMTDAERGATHGIIAATMERLYASSDLHAAALGYHFEEHSQRRKRVPFPSLAAGITTESARDEKAAQVHAGVGRFLLKSSSGRSAIHSCHSSRGAAIGGTSFFANAACSDEE
jgi:serine/threonine protein kinase